MTQVPLSKQDSDQDPNQDPNQDPRSSNDTIAEQDEMTRQALQIIEALLFASAEPVPERMLAARIHEGLSVKSLLRRLQEDYLERGVRLVKVGNSWAFRTAQDIAAVLNKDVEVVRPLSKAAMETLAIIAWHQPVSRPDIEQIRGVSISRGTLNILFEKNWIKPCGHRDTPGRPALWGTTDVFLDHFGLESIHSLPGIKELKAAGLLESGPALDIYRGFQAREEEIPLPEPEPPTEAAEEPLPADDAP